MRDDNKKEALIDVQRELKAFREKYKERYCLMIKYNCNLCCLFCDNICDNPFCYSVFSMKYCTLRVSAIEYLATKLNPCHIPNRRRI